MKLHLTLKAIVAALVLVASGAQAVSVTYSFTATDNNSGTFTFNDGATSNGNGPYASGGTSYTATSFVVDGHSVSSPELVLYQDFGGNQFAYLTTTSGYTDYVQLASSGTSLFSSSSASQMDGKSLASFDLTSADILYIQGNEYQLTSLTEVAAVPEPETYALLLAGLVGMSVVVRRRRA
jgi:hypothetical protein